MSNKEKGRRGRDGREAERLAAGANDTPEARDDSGEEAREEALLPKGNALPRVGQQPETPAKTTPA